jgi:hypothetical protein
MIKIGDARGDITVCQLWLDKDPFKNEHDVLVGKITSLEQLNSVRQQIQNDDVEGYYLLWMNPPDCVVEREPLIKTTRIYINRYGAILEWPQYMFDLASRQSEEILRKAMNKRKNENRI